MCNEVNLSIFVAFNDLNVLSLLIDMVLILAPRNSNNSVVNVSRLMPVREKKSGYSKKDTQNVHSGEKPSY